MKDVTTIWNSLLGRTYSAVATNTNRSYDKCDENSPTQVVCRFINGKYKCSLTLAFFGILGILSGCFILIINPYDFLFKWKVVFSNGGEIFEMWRKPPVDLYLRVFLWNVTNKEEYMSGKDSKLKLKEVGPYVYRELMVHDNITFNINGTVSAAPKHPLVWVPELSEGRKEDDLLILPNIALLSITHVVSQESYFTRLGLNLLIRQLNQEPLVQMTAREFMFGYESSLMTLGNNFMPNWIYFDKLGLIDRMYEFTGDYETVYTGETDLRKTGLLDTYNGDTKISQWDSPCGNIQGASDGTKFPSFIQPNDTLKFFRKSMCRAKDLIRVNTTVLNDLEAYVYHFKNNQDDNGKINSDNSCFCYNKDTCLPNGLLDVHKCYYGFPIALSYPHFLDGDNILNAKIIGSDPNPEAHRSYFIINPNSGLPLELAVRYQINMALGNIENMANVEKFSDMVLPLLWTENRLYSLPDVLKARFKLYLNVLPLVQEILLYCLFIAGGCFCILSAINFRRTFKNASIYNSPWIDDEMSFNIDRKISNYIPERRSSMTPKELEGYISSLVAPLNQEISFREFQELKEVDV